MGTRSIVLVKQRVNGVNQVKRLYKHWDGYPTDNLKMIRQALLSSTIDVFVKHCEAYYGRDMVEEEFQSETFQDDMLGNQGDLEFIYTVDLDAKQVKVFGGGYTGRPPQVAYRNGTIDPRTYADQLLDEYQDRERIAINEHVSAIKSLGFSVNKDKN